MIKKFLEFSIDRPVLNHLVMLLMFAMAIFAYKSIPKEIFPPSDLDEISISGSYIGASADVLDKMAVKGIEDDLKSISQIDTIFSTIQNGFFTIRAEILPGNDNQAVLGDVKDIIAQNKRDLPSDMDEPIAKIVVHDYPLVLVAVAGGKNMKDLVDAANDLKDRLTLIDDLADIQIRGESDEEVLITLDQMKIDAYGLSKSAVYSAIGSLSSIFPVGTVKAKGEHLYISTINGEKSKEKLEQSLLSVNGKRFYLSDIASVKVGLAEPLQLSHFNSKANISLDIKKTKDGNAIELSKKVREVLVEYNQKYKGELVFEAYTDTSIWIKNRLNLVSSNIMFGLILVMIALLLTLNIRIALAVVIGIFASFMITLIAADLMGESINMLSLMGALIALGMLVDEAIVVAENIYRHVEMGKAPREAAIDGATEMFPAILTATLTTVFAFLPLLIMTGKMGMFMKILPIMITILLISSLFEAFYFLPLHSKELLSIGKVEKIQKKENKFWKMLTDWYKAILEKLLHFKMSALFLLVISIVVGSMAMMKVTKFQLMPEFDVQQVYLNGKVNINNSLEETEAYVTNIEEQLLGYLKKEDMDSVTSVIGFKMNPDKTFETGENLFHIFINLHERAPENFFDKYVNPIFSLEYDDSKMIRVRSAQTVAKEVQEGILEKMRQLKDKAGNKVFEEFNIYAQQTGMVGNDIEIGFSNISQKKVLEALAKVKSKLSTIEGVSDIGDNATEGERELKLRVNEYGQSLGLNENYITQALRGSFFKAEYSKMFNEEGLLRVKVEDKYKDEKNTLSDFKLTTPDGQVVVIKEVCDFYYQKSFVRIFKEDGTKVNSLYAAVNKEKIVPEEVMKQLEPLLDALQEEGIEVIIKGEKEANDKIVSEIMQAALIAAFLIFITLVWMFNSFVQPLIILSIIPLSLLGVLVGTKIMGLNMTMTGAMGIVGLAGVVVNDGLIMLEFVRKAKNKAEILKYAGQRLRPIVLTSVTTVLGLGSLIFFASGQALILQPMAISLGFGIAWATVLNLYFVPLMFAVLYRVGERERKELWSPFNSKNKIENGV
ncbi:MAG: RND multidrug efflux transporter; Acriflavin resistance protein [uncultured Sulfurovum sp.]|uniref:RND multidrug efflux transporter Acriflavin resistance protein n=1 Tax=uncultured Sulfurovum sp. TaxID=269237 RepID=A0A6S6TBE3_9BACT|nr:MAG: RND multidrug efflux transporter; Acriflavin resistance protein [uncultured Sulfurovum sp.]